MIVQLAFPPVCFASPPSHEAACGFAELMRTDQPTALRCLEATYITEEEASTVETGGSKELNHMEDPLVNADELGADQLQKTSWEQEARKDAADLPSASEEGLPQSSCTTSRPQTDHSTPGGTPTGSVSSPSCTQFTHFSRLTLSRFSPFPDTQKAVCAGADG